MKELLLGLAAVVLGLATFFAVAIMVEWAGQVFYPMPAEVDLRNPRAVRAMSEKLPAGVFVWALVAWAAGAFVGSMVAALLAPANRMLFGLAIGAFGLLAAILNMQIVPHPTWVWVLGLCEFLPAAYLGAKLATPAPSNGIERPQE